MKKTIFITLIMAFSLHIFAQNAQQLYRQAESLRKQGQYLKAKNLYNSLTYLRQSDKDYLGLGQCYVALHKPDSAYVALNKARLLNPGNAQVYYTMGLMYLTGYGQPGKAIENFKQAYSLAPDSLNYALYIGLAYQARGNLDSAYAFYSLVMKRDTSNPYPYYFLADYLYEIDSLQQAYDFVNTAIRKSTENYNFYYLKASIEYKARLYELALHSINKALEINPQSRKLLVFKAQVLYQLQQYDKVIKILEPLVTTETDNLNPHYYLAWSYYYTAQYDKAKKICELALSQDNKIPEFYQILAYIYIAQGDYNKAQKAADKLLQLSPGNMAAYNLKIAASLYSRTPAGVIGSDKKFTKINALNLDYIHTALKDEASHYYYDRLWKKFQSKPERLSLDEYAMLYLGYAMDNEINRTKPSEYMNLYARGKYEECVLSARRAIGQYPLDQNAYLYMALSYQHLTKPELFIKNLTIYHGLQKAIAATGDGMSYQTAYLVTNQDDIYYVISYTMGNPARALTFGMSDKLQDGKQYTIVNIGFRPQENNTVYFLKFK